MVVRQRRIRLWRKGSKSAPWSLEPRTLNESAVFFLLALSCAGVLGQQRFRNVKVRVDVLAVILLFERIEER